LAFLYEFNLDELFVLFYPKGLAGKAFEVDLKF